MPVIERRLRTNAGPVILTSNRASLHRTDPSKHNVLIDIARDNYSGFDIEIWACDLLETATWLRIAYDSTRLGGGIDADIQLRGDGPESGSAVFDTHQTIKGIIEAHFIEADTVQDWIAHAEAVARLTLAVFGND